MISTKKLNSLGSSLSYQKVSLWIAFGLFLVICGKFYHLFGVDSVNQPVAPLPIIILRDVFTLGFLLVFGFLSRQYLGISKLFWLLWVTGLLISLIQWIGPKDLNTWGQHYIRNLLLPLLFYPVLLGLFKKKIYIPIRPVLIWVFITSIIISYIQLYLSNGPTRPAAVFHDPIVNSMILFWGLAAIALEKGKVPFIIAFLCLAPLLQYLSSLTAFLSILLGLLTALFSIRKYLTEYIRNHFKKFAATVVVAVMCLAAVVWLTQMKDQSDEDFAGAKIKALYESIFCSQEGCQHRSYSGRVVSNLRPYVLCKESLPSCFVGNLQTAAYERLESSWGSLVANWGIIFCLIYVFWMGKHFLFSFKIDSQEKPYDRDLVFWKIVFYSGLCFSIFNTMPYRYPINIILYIGLAYFMAKKTEIRNEI